MSDSLSVFSGAKIDLCFLSKIILYIDAVTYMNIKHSSAVSSVAKHFSKKVEKLLQIMMKRLLVLVGVFYAIMSLAKCLCCLLWMHAFGHILSHEVLTFGRVL